jgi:hypothetical protein
MGIKFELSSPSAMIIPKRIAKKMDVANEKLNDTNDKGSK